MRFHGRYYIRYHQYDGYFEELGAKIVARIPTDPGEYQSTPPKDGMCCDDILTIP